MTSLFFRPPPISAVYMAITRLDPQYIVPVAHHFFFYISAAAADLFKQFLRVRGDRAQLSNHVIA